MHGWESQQSGRLVNPTIAGRLKVVAHLMAFTGGYPWRWQPVDVEEWTASLCAGGARTYLTLRTYQGAVAMFCDCPVRICHEWNAGRHVSEFEACARIRPFAREELQRLIPLLTRSAEIRRAEGSAPGPAVGLGAGQPPRR